MKSTFDSFNEWTIGLDKHPGLQSQNTYDLDCCHCNTSFLARLNITAGPRIRQKSLEANNVTDLRLKVGK
jgi:hypothetical protein